MTDGRQVHAGRNGRDDAPPAVFVHGMPGLGRTAVTTREEQAEGEH